MDELQRSGGSLPTIVGPERLSTTIEATTIEADRLNSSTASKSWLMINKAGRTDISLYSI